MEEKFIHMSCLGILCDPDIHFLVSKMSKEDYKSITTFDIDAVTCPKCIEILKKQRII